MGNETSTAVAGSPDKAQSDQIFNSTRKDTSYRSEGWTTAKLCGLTNTELHTVGRHCQGGGHFVSGLWQRFSKQGA